MQVDVTFLIPAFNAENTIGLAIGSALAQENVSVEVVVVDDHSHDGTIDIARSFDAGKVRVLALPQNRGPGGARNAGLEIARGRWVAMLDADDAVYPDRMRRLLQLAEEEDAQIVVDNINVIGEGGGSSRAMFDHAHLAGLRELTLERFIAGNLLFRRTFSFGYMKPVFERQFLLENSIRYMERLPVGEDYLFIASALAQGARCAVEPKAGYIYLVRAGSISRVLRLDHVEAMLEADRVFLSEHRLGAAASAAQRKRTRSLEQGAAFLEIVDHLKERSPTKALSAAARDPMALWHLRMPVAARLKRMLQAATPLPRPRDRAPSFNAE
jgi:succinoglycan biosynthesis protein ExoO